MLTVEDTVRSYSGKPGCMCGCNGKYSETDRARKMAITQMLKNPAVALQTWSPSGGDAGCLYIDTPTRTRALYITEAGVQKLRDTMPHLFA
jgi:hypothetical protein